MWDLPGPGLEPVSPALAGGFLTTAPPVKSPMLYFTYSGLIYLLSRSLYLLVPSPISSPPYPHFFKEVFQGGRRLDKVTFQLWDLMIVIVSKISTGKINPS